MIDLIFWFTLAAALCALMLAAEAAERRRA